MAQLLPDKEKQKPLAFMLLGIVLIAIYWLGFHWYVVKRGEQSEQIATLQQTEAQNQGWIQMGPKLQQQINLLEQTQSESSSFLPQENVNLASASLTSRLKGLIDEHAGDNSEQCKITSNSPNTRVSGKERYQRVVNKVRLRCEVDYLFKILYAMETQSPLIFFDNFSIYRQTSRVRQNRQMVTTQYLDVRFDMYGYIRQPGDAT